MAIPELKDLMKLPVAAKWKQLGVQLGVPTHTLDEIQANHENSPNFAQECLRDMFNWWLNNGRDVTPEKLECGSEILERHNWLHNSTHMVRRCMHTNQLMNHYVWSSGGPSLIPRHHPSICPIANLFYSICNESDHIEHLFQSFRWWYKMAFLYTMAGHTISSACCCMFLHVSTSLPSKHVASYIWTRGVRWQRDWAKSVKWLDWKHYHH